MYIKRISAWVIIDNKNIFLAILDSTTTTNLEFENKSFSKAMQTTIANSFNIRHQNEIFSFELNSNLNKILLN